MKTSKPGFAVYLDKKRQWRWRAVGDTGRVLAVSSEAYKNRTDAVNGAVATAKIIKRWLR